MIRVVLIFPTGLSMSEFQLVKNLGKAMIGIISSISYDGDIDCIVHECAMPKILSKAKKANHWTIPLGLKTARPSSSELLADNKPVQRRMGSSSLTSWVGLLHNGLAIGKSVIRVQILCYWYKMIVLL